MRPALVLIGLAAALTACAPSTPARQAPRASAPPISQPLPPPSRYATPTPYVTAAPSAQPRPPATAADACGAAAHEYLVGKNRSEIPIPVNPALRRVSCTTCPVTLEFNPRRLNIIFDQASGNVTEVKCG